MRIFLVPTWLQEFEKEAGYMSKQAEIRGGINMKAPIPQVINGVLLGLLNNYDKYKSVVDGLSNDYVSLDEYLARAITGIMIGLDSQGVVLKVASVTQDIDCHYQPAIVAVESLIGYAEPTFNNSAKE